MKLSDAKPRDIQLGRKVMNAIQCGEIGTACGKLFALTSGGTSFAVWGNLPGGSHGAIATIVCSDGKITIKRESTKVIERAIDDKIITREQYAYVEEQRARIITHLAESGFLI